MYDILVVDDDRVARYLLKRNNLFKEHGFVIADEAADGYEALRKVASSHFDMVFADIKMPKIDGIEFLRELRKKNSDLCVAFMSGYSDFNYTRQGIILGAFDYILKPVDNTSLSDLLSRARVHLDKKNEDAALHKKLSVIIDESLNISGFGEDILKLFRLITASPEEAPLFAEQIVKNFIVFYKNDTDKIEIMLKHTQENLRKMLLKTAPWFAYLNLSNIENEVKSIDAGSSLTAVEKFKLYVQYMTSVVRRLHLDQQDSVVRQLCQYVLSNCDKKINLETISEELGFSSSYLGRLFKHKTGERYIEYVTKIKIERAKALLLTGKYKNYEISDMLNFGKVDYFCSVFKKYTGMTPMAYRKSVNSYRK